MYQIIIIIHTLVALALIGLVLIQHGKGADIGAGLGSGASNTVFGSRGTGSFLFKATAGLACVFFVTSLTLSSLVASQYQSASILAIPKQSNSDVVLPVPVDQAPAQ